METTVNGTEKRICVGAIRDITGNMGLCHFPYATLFFRNLILTVRA